MVHVEGQRFLWCRWLRSVRGHRLRLRDCIASSWRRGGDTGRRAADWRGGMKQRRGVRRERKEQGRHVTVMNEQMRTQQDNVMQHVLL